MYDCGAAQNVESMMTTAKPCERHQAQIANKLRCEGAAVANGVQCFVADTDCIVMAKSCDGSSYFARMPIQYTHAGSKLQIALLSQHFIVIVSSCYCFHLLSSNTCAVL